jgi:hypothetical protein
MKVLLYPLIGILHMAAITYDAFSFSHELGVVMAGMIASNLIGIIYFSPLGLALLLVPKRFRRLTCRVIRLRLLAIVWLGTIASMLLGEILAYAPLMATGATLFVAFTIGLSAMVIATAMSKCLHRYVSRIAWRIV